MNSPPIQAPETYLEILKQRGLLNHISDADYQAKLAQASAVKMVYPVDMLNVFALVDDVVWQVSSWHKVATQNITSKLALIAHNQFMPDFDEGVAEMGMNTAVNLANQQLAEAGRDERYYWLMFPDDGVYGPYRGWGLIFLTYAQRHDPRLHKLVPFHPDQKHTWTQRRLDEFLAHLSELGLLAPYTPEQIADARQEFRPFERMLAYAIFLAFPEMSFNFDTEMIDHPTQDYPRLIEDTAHVSNGIFTPTNIQCVLIDDDDNFLLSLEFHGRRFEHVLRSSTEWVNVNYVAWLNEILKEEGERGVYHRLLTYDQTASFLFLTAEQSAIAREKALIPFDEEWLPFI